MALENAWNLTEASEYITYYAIDNEDFLAADDVGKTKLLNVADRTLKRAFKGSVIPAEAAYLFAAHLGGLFNDTTVLAQRGVASFGISGINFTFKDWAKKDLDEMIPADVRELIEESNGGTDGGSSRVKAWVL